MTKWTKWADISQRTDNDCTVYKIRFIAESGKPIIIKRFFAEDREGILSIGKTTNMERRRTEFLRGYERFITGHVAGRLLYFLKQQQFFKDHFSNCQCQYCFKSCAFSEEAVRIEKKLIIEYVCKYGEVPPLNSVIPGRPALLDAMKYEKR